MRVEICKCGHPQQRHVMLRARCAVEDCNCVHFEMADKWEVLAKAVELDEQLELVRKELRRLRAWNRALLSGADLPDELDTLVQKVELARETFMQIVSDPTSSRAAVQAAALRALEKLG